MILYLGTRKILWNFIVGSGKIRGGSGLPELSLASSFDVASDPLI